MSTMNHKKHSESVAITSNDQVNQAYNGGEDNIISSRQKSQSRLSHKRRHSSESNNKVPPILPLRQRLTEKPTKAQQAKPKTHRRSSGANSKQLL